MATERSCYFCNETQTQIDERDGFMCRMGNADTRKEIDLCEDCAVGLCTTMFDGLDRHARNYVAGHVLDQTDALRIARPYDSYEQAMEDAPTFLQAVVIGTNKMRSVRREMDESFDALRSAFAEMVAR